jgi:hypothetical protein
MPGRTKSSSLLLQTNIKTPHIDTIYCDMDGVLCNYADAILKLMDSGLYQNNILNSLYALARNSVGGRKFTIQDIWWNKSREDAVVAFMYALATNNKDLWVNLDWMPGAKQLWNYIAPYNPILLTAPIDQACIDGKKIWIKMHLGNFKTIFDEKKYRWALSNALLIDDRDSFVEEFHKEGGYAILHNSVSSTILLLKSLLKLK